MIGIARAATAVMAILGSIIEPAAAVSGQSPGSRADVIDRRVALGDGRTIYLQCEGSGPFTVLLEPGEGGKRVVLARLSRALSARYRVCVYDRRNVGRSSAAPVPRKAADLSDDLFDALRAARVSGPFILFGSSMGGLLVRLHAARHPVAGYVTSNQPGTSGEWVPVAYPSMTEEDRALDARWAAGDNIEHIDVRDVGRVVAAAGPPRFPHIVLVSTERYQCPAAGICGATYRAFVTMSQALAAQGSGGAFRVVDGDHDLYVTNMPDVIAAIDQVAAAAGAHAVPASHDLP